MKLDFPIIRGSALGALNGVPQWEEKVMELMDAVAVSYTHLMDFVIIPTLLKPVFSNTRMEGKLCSKTSANIRIVFV